MDVKTIINLISSVGFPIVMCGMMGWFIKYQMDQNSKAMNNIIEKINDILEENKQAISEILEEVKSERDNGSK